MKIVEPSPDSPTWPIVLQFAKLMEHKLACHRHKGDREGWMKDDFWDLHERILEEAKELFSELDSNPTGMTPLNIVLEAADVANFAMMCADCATKGVILDPNLSEAQTCEAMGITSEARNSEV